MALVRAIGSEYACEAMPLSIAHEDVHISEKIA
jgi:hypothetical protein